MRLEPLVNGAVRWLAYYHRLEQVADGHRRGRRQTLERRSEFYRRIWTQAAAEAGASVRRLDGVLEIRYEDAVIRVNNNVTSLDDPVTVAMAGNKVLGYALLAGCGLPLPPYLACRRDDSQAAWRFVAAQGGPCVVKPAHDTGGGEGVTTGVGTRLQLFSAMALAGGFGRQILIEKQVEGDNYRLLYLDGTLLDAVRRVPPTIHGDGRSSVKQLIQSENEDRLRSGIDASQTLLATDWDLRHTLRRNGFSLRSVPSEGLPIQLKTVINDNRRRDNVRVFDACDAVIGAGAAAAAALGMRLAGVDVITRDVTVPLEESGGVIIEVNAMPGLYFHDTMDNGVVPLVHKILDGVARVPTVIDSGRTA